MCKRFRLREDQYLGGALSLAPPALLLDPFSSAFSPCFSEHRSANGRRVRRLDAVLLGRSLARNEVDLPGIARVMDTFFWSLLARAGQMKEAELSQALDPAAYPIHHALFLD